MSFATIRFGFGTLRARLTLWNTVVLLVFVALTLMGVREGLRGMRYGWLDEFLEDEIAEIRDEIREQAPRWDEIHKELDNKATDHARRKMFIQLFRRSGELQFSSAHTPEEDWTSKPLSRSDRPIVVGDYRIVQRPLEGSDLVIRVGATNQRVVRELDEFTRFMLTIGGVVLLVSPIVGYLLAGRATHPLSRIIDTAARLQPAQLDARLPVRGTHDELDRLSQTINGLLDRIARYLEQNREFNAHAAHELRTPLAAIQSSLEVTLLGDRTVEEYKEELQDLLEELNQLRILVNQLLLLAEGDAGQLCTVREPTRVDQIVRKAADMFQAVSEVKGIALRIERAEPILVPADSSALRQVVNNLLDNAIKYTPSGGSITLDLSCAESGGDCVLRMRDTGIGIGAADLPHIFQRFYRADKSRARDRRNRGTGLGLSICRAIVEAHSGTITAESTPGQGATFTVRLPGARPTSAEDQAPADHSREPIVQ
jgi:two-component system, OmpR family, heavy metal sensor histidine kinase CusS